MKSQTAAVKHCFESGSSPGTRYAPASPSLLPDVITV